MDRGGERLKGAVGFVQPGRRRETACNAANRANRCGVCARKEWSYNMKLTLQGLGEIEAEDFLEKESSGGVFHAGRDGVQRVLSTYDRKVDFIQFADKTLAHVHSAMGYPALYPVNRPAYAGGALAVLMDLDGTSVHSERFWIWIIEKTLAELMGDPRFSLQEKDLPFVSGHSVSEHLQYGIDAYCPGKKVEEARAIYFRLTEEELDKIMEGRGYPDAFVPAPQLKEFLLKLKERKIRVGLVTSGLREKAWPEILSAFRTMQMGDPLQYYDAIITAGTAIKKGQTGTLGELAPKPHPWLYAEALRVGLGIDNTDKARVLGMEDSSAGALSLTLAGIQCAGVEGGNIEKGRVGSLCLTNGCRLMEVLELL